MTSHPVDEALADRVLAFLDDVMELDHRALQTLFNVRVECNERLAQHPSVQVRSEPGKLSVGLLGLLNGLCGAYPDGWGPLMAAADDDGVVDHFLRTPTMRPSDRHRVKASSSGNAAPSVTEKMHGPEERMATPALTTASGRDVFIVYGERDEDGSCARWTVAAYFDPHLAESRRVAAMERNAQLCEAWRVFDESDPSPAAVSTWLAAQKNEHDVDLDPFELGDDGVPDFPNGYFIETVKVVG